MWHMTLFSYDIFVTIIIMCEAGIFKLYICQLLFVRRLSIREKFFLNSLPRINWISYCFNRFLLFVKYQLENSIQLSIDFLFNFFLCVLKPVTFLKRCITKCTIHSFLEIRKNEIILNTKDQYQSHQRKEIVCWSFPKHA